MIGGLEGPQRSGIISFRLTSTESHLVARIMDQRHGVAVRSGHHCAEPLHRFLGIPPTVRASLHVYSNERDIETLVKGVAAIAAVGA